MGLEHGMWIGLEIDSRAPMRGRLTTEDRRVREFEGWLQLISALSEPTPTEDDDRRTGGQQR
jgi:hypothetical protein